MIKRQASSARRLAIGVCLVTMTIIGGCPTPVTSDAFESISELGFGPDTLLDLNHYPWTMRHFVPTGAASGHVYVATGNSVVYHILSRVGVDVKLDPINRPPEIRRYRPDLGPKTWERVLDFRTFEPLDDWVTSGIRYMAEYQPPGDDQKYLYAGTFGKQVQLWRSPTGEPDSWEKVWTLDAPGSIRWMTPHNGILYLAITHEFEVPPAPPGELWATDGQDVWLINNNGFGNDKNTAFFSLASFNDWLYVGTLNREEGFEVWKLAGPGGSMDPIQVVDAGGAAPANMGVSEMHVFDEHLYIPAVVFIGLGAEGVAQRGADMIRLDKNDTMEVIVGPGSIAGIDSGFGVPTNGYLWSLVEHNGRLYCGTWDANAVLPILGFFLEDILTSEKLTLFKPFRDPYDRLTNKGCELHVSDDGVHWETVFNDGLGNPDHYGVRTMISADGYLYLGMANVLDGLEIFRATNP